MHATITYQIDSTTKIMVVNGVNISVKLFPSGRGFVDVLDKDRNTVRSLIFNRLEMVDVDRSPASTT